MKTFEGFGIHREPPSTGYLVSNGRVMVQLSRTSTVDAEELVKILSKYCGKNEYLVICYYTHCLYVTTKNYYANKAEAKAAARNSKLNVIVNLVTDQVEEVD